MYHKIGHCCVHKFSHSRINKTRKTRTFSTAMKMTNFVLCLLLVIFTSAEPYCSRSSRNRWMERKTRGCRANESSNGVGSGRVSNLTAKCHHNSHQPHNEFSYKLSWEQQTTTTTPVTEYRIKIWYENYRRYLCFFVPASQRHFVFNQTMGLRYGCHFSFSVMALPIAYVNGIIQTGIEQVIGCPLPPRLDPLPNVVVNRGIDHVFKASFEYEPTPSPTISWYFSSDKRNCHQPRLLHNETSDNIEISTGGRFLRIHEVSVSQTGCYIVVADNGIGAPQRRRGYLDVNETVHRHSDKDYGGNILVPVFLPATGVMLLLLLCLFIAMYKNKEVQAKEEVKPFC